MTAGIQQQPPSCQLTPTPSVVPSPASVHWARATVVDAMGADAVEFISLRMLRGGTKKLAALTLADGAELVAKQYADDRGAWTNRWMHRLVDAGLAEPARHTVTEPRGWSPAQQTLLADAAPGQPWSQSILASPADRAEAATRAADWLGRLQSTSTPLPDRTGYRAAAGMRRQGEELAIRYPAHWARLRRVITTARGRLSDSAASAVLVPSHGDFHPNNVFMTPGPDAITTAIDLDTAGLRRPAYDVGYALAQLLIMSWMQTGSFRAGAAAGQVFGDRWRAADPADATAVPAEVARALVQSLHFELVTYRTGRTYLLDAWLDIAEMMLADGVTETLDALGADPAVSR